MPYMTLRYLTALLIALPLCTTAEVHPVGQLQQELTNWSSNGSGSRGKQLGDGGAYGVDHNSNGASWIGLAASQTLSRRYQGIAHASFDIDVDELNNLSGREAWLGLTSSQSQWRFGTVHSPYRRATAEWDPFLGTFMQARGNGAISDQHSNHIDNAIDYRSNWYGIKVDLLYGLDEADRDLNGSTDDSNSSAIALGWQTGNWDLNASYQDHTPELTTTMASKLAARYQGESWSFVMQHERTLNSGDRAQYSYLNTSYRDTLTEYAFALGSRRDDNPANLDLDYISIGMKHALTDSAMVHLGYRFTKERAPDRLKESAWGLGLRYRF